MIEMTQQEADRIISKYHEKQLLQNTKSIPEEFILAFNSASMVEDQMPITFSNGQEIEELDPQCGACGTSLSGQYVRGKIAATPGYLVFRGFVFCPDCKLFIRIHMRINQMMYLQTEVKKGVWENNQLT